MKRRRESGMVRRSCSLWVISLHFIDMSFRLIDASFIGKLDSHSAMSVRSCQIRPFPHPVFWEDSFTRQVEESIIPGNIDSSSFRWSSRCLPILLSFRTRTRSKL